MSHLDKISSYLVKYYKITPKTPYLAEMMDYSSLLDVNRFDLGAKLYYIRSWETGCNRVLAETLYDKHIEAFQDGIVLEAGNADKKGRKSYHTAFHALIKAFQEDTFDSEREWIPVDRNGQILDGAHRLACAVYYGVQVKVIRFPDIEGQKFGFAFFRNRGMEKGYLRLMAAELSYYRKDIRLLSLKGRKFCSCYTALEEQHGAVWKLLYAEKAKVDERKAGKMYWCIAATRRNQPYKVWEKEYCNIQRLFAIKRVEQKQEITVNQEEQKRCRRIRRIRNRYTRLLIGLKKSLGKPI